MALADESLRIKGACVAMTNFQTTRWSLIRAAASSQPGEARQALEALCSTYWYPLYAYIRHRGYAAEDAKDLTQEFFARLLEKDYLKSVDPSKGKFRSFLLASVNHFLSNERDRANTIKRGGNLVFLRLDFGAIEERYIAAASQPVSAEALFERAWALASLEATLARLRSEYGKVGKAKLFETLEGTLTGCEDLIPYRDLGIQLGISEGAVKSAVFRLRHRYRDVLIGEIAQTLAEDESVDEELHRLLAALRT